MRFWFALWYALGTKSLKTTDVNGERDLSVEIQGYFLVTNSYKVPQSNTGGQSQSQL